MIVISTAHGLKFTEFKARYHEGKLEFPSAHANQPVAMGSEPDEVVAALHRVLDARASGSGRGECLQDRSRRRP